MKNTHPFKISCMILLALICIFAGNAFAEDEFFETDMELFTMGDFPELPSIQTYSRNSLDSYLYSELKKGTARIDISAYEIPKADLSLTLTMIVNDHPDLFYVGSRIRYTMIGNYVGSYTPEYLFTGADLKARQNAFDASVDEIVAHASRASTTIGKLILVNDYFCANYAYDKSLSIFRPDLLFTGKTGVCQAYMLAYAAVLDELGIANTHATSISMQHTWNLVNVGDDWYHIDVTWNDPLPDTTLRSLHRYFMLSDSCMLKAQHKDWEYSVSASDTTYDNYFWQEINTPLAPVGNSIYYLSTTASDGIRSLMNWDLSSHSSSKVMDFSILGEDNTYLYSSSMGPVAADENSIYYASRGTLWALDRSSLQTTPVYFTQDDSIIIWGCYLEKDTLYMTIGKSNTSLQLVSCPVNQRLNIRFNSNLVELFPGESTELKVIINMNLPDVPVFTLSSSNPEVITIDSRNCLTAVSTGIAYITASSDDYADVLCPVIVHSTEQMVLPRGVTHITQESFHGIAATEIVLPDEVKSIDADAFSSCENLYLVYLPESVESIDETAFQGNTSLSLICHEKSAGHDFAQTHSIPYVLVPDSE